jgi:lysophospholipase L1-like esterase
MDGANCVSKWIIAFFALCLSACGGGTQSAQPSHPISNVVAFMGDSIIHRWDLTQYDPGPTTNLGIEGNTTAQMLARFNDVLATAPGVVVIFGGGNDLIIDGEVKTDSIAAMAKMATAAGIRVILCAMTPADIPPDVQASVQAAYPKDQLNNAHIEPFNQELITLARENGYLYADYYDAMLTNGQFDPSLYVDGLHPNAAGYARMWAVIEPLLNESLQ